MLTTQYLEITVFQVLEVTLLILLVQQVAITEESHLMVEQL